MSDAPLTSAEALELSKEVFDQLITFKALAPATKATLSACDTSKATFSFALNILKGNYALGEFPAQPPEDQDSAPAVTCAFEAAKYLTRQILEQAPVCHKATVACKAS